MIVQKPAGRPTHPNEKGQTGTLANLVAFHFQANGEEKRVRHIHRLDQDTSGTVIFAKHRLAHAVLDQMLSKKRSTELTSPSQKDFSRKRKARSMQRSAVTSIMPSDEESLLLVKVL
ncbi:hypothetical protein BsIDN1_17040 [Bacillus safensis]|uniref:Pseudouridine synthase RsuA/RluA-like domain-containing protein n=1 Tax=Bacillus safensis TaxID=561879 RepID=A0A5S9M964_BACIA|nr:hypothetical protein BsIDN1_17040 [Bacillus safensis]